MWISVKKELPKDDEYVFVCNSDNGAPQCLDIAYYTGTKWIDSEDNETWPDYWMPVPDLPE